MKLKKIIQNFIFQEKYEAILTILQIILESNQIIVKKNYFFYNNFEGKIIEGEDFSSELLRILSLNKNSYGKKGIECLRKATPNSIKSAKITLPKSNEGELFFVDRLS